MSEQGVPRPPPLEGASTTPAVLSSVLPRASLEAEPSVSFVLDAGGRIAYVNAAWDAFARANGGQASVLSDAVVGTPFAAHIDGAEPRRFYEELVARTARSAWGLVHHSECNTPTLKRVLATRFDPLRSGAACVGVVVISSIVSEGPLDAPPAPGPRPDELVWPEGVIRQCSCCRRVLDPKTSGWRTVPVLIASVDPRVTHGLCPQCDAIYYQRS